jgi:hypothetical protein
MDHDDDDTKNDVCTECGVLYVIADGHSCGATVERYPLTLAYLAGERDFATVAAAQLRNDSPAGATKAERASDMAALWCARNGVEVLADC